jgi:peptide deformylase
VRQFPDPVLKNPASDVAEVDDEVRRLIDRMTDVMSTAHGVGLAAPQIGVSRRVLIYRGSEEEGVRALVNPALVERSEETEVDTEGCLSLLGGDLSVPIERHVRVRVAGLDGEGQPLEIEAEGLEARIIQHEVDHLDGVLITDRAPAEERRTALRELRLRAG